MRGRCGSATAGDHLTALEDPSLAGSLTWLQGFRTELEAAGRDPASYELLVCEQPLVFADRPDPAAPLSGPPEAIAETLHRLRDAGVTMIWVLADEASVERFGMRCGRCSDQSSVREQEADPSEVACGATYSGAA